MNTGRGDLTFGSYNSATENKNKNITMAKKRINLNFISVYL
jgi:hypothetical protein